MISFPDGLFEKFGHDALRVYRPDEDFVIKLRRWTPAARWYVEAYNELFGDRTPYEILGEEEYCGCPVLKLRLSRPVIDLHSISSRRVYGEGQEAVFAGFKAEDHGGNPRWQVDKRVASL